MKIGDSLSELIHSSGEDILISYRTGAKVQIKNGMITKIFDTKNHSELNWQLDDWQNEKIKELKKAASTK